MQQKKKKKRSQVVQWVRSLDLTVHASLSPVQRAFAPGFVNWSPWYSWNIAESGVKHQKFKFKLQQKIHNVPVIKNKQYITIHNIIKQKHTTKKGKKKVPGGSMS